MSRLPRNHDRRQTSSKVMSPRSLARARIPEIPLECVEGPGRREYHILCFNFNVDGAVRLSDSIATCGGLVRDENSNWIIGFFRSLGCFHVLFAKLWRVHDAFKHIWSLGHKRLVIETNNVEVVELLNGNLDTRHRNTLVSTIQHILHLDWNVRIHKVECDYNRSVNALASASPEVPVGETIYYNSMARVVYGLIQESF
ncbi:hypothetical protein V6N12_003699 [Hibiscus sabdariffa]|uniref:RNase H type-1 domain-containing protein n=1 Tax=Hibiscus sabdariffa TaxID=183260 RepID=A0ABR1ZTN7_9ROSI